MSKHPVSSSSQPGSYFWPVTTALHLLTSENGSRLMNLINRRVELSVSQRSIYNGPGACATHPTKTDRSLACVCSAGRDVHDRCSFGVQGSTQRPVDTGKWVYKVIISEIVSHIISPHHTPSRCSHVPHPQFLIILLVHYWVKQCHKFAVTLFVYLFIRNYVNCSLFQTQERCLVQCKQSWKSTK